MLCGARARAGAARDPAERLIAGASTCPSPAAVRAEVETLVPRERLNARLRAIGGPGAPVELIDLGVPFKVVTAGSVREYRDEARDCAYRARIAAVYVALVIDPAAISTAQPSAPATVETAVAAPPPARVPPSAPVAPLRARARLALGAGFEGGLGSDARVGQAGVALRLGAGAGRIALSVGAAALAPVDTSVGGVRLHQWRLPADVSVRAQGTMRLGKSRFLEPYGELGLGLALMRESGLELATRQTRDAIELGVRAAAGVQLAGASRLAPFVALHAELVPNPPAISALPRGVVGHTPALWIGATAGASWRLF